ncbi:LytR family transcriptional regulator [Cohnella endophytica]|uniref:LytR family transcriptional regulator n=1 Tax=Cohnella endophytica TaxID=2419778 RepID=A0A494Y401_9BACL|nr:LCP family protein [Cohnella endophytica]RKP55006.1 LytR family transcriptional regulator [Cohnella endophytica]
MPKKRKSKSLRYYLRIAGLTAGTLLIATACYAGYIYLKANEAIHRIAAPADAMNMKTDASNEAQKEIRPFIVLLAGVDSRAGSGGTQNTDVLMLVSINPLTHSASMVSLPRDLLLKPKILPDRKANYYFAYYYAKDKASAISNTKQFFSDLFKLPIDYMAVVNFDALRQMVDAVGGLEIDVDMDMKYVDNVDGTRIDLKKGLQKLNGQQVLDFVRYRKSNRGTQESSDFARNDRQKQVIKHIAGKLGAFQGMSQWGKILDIIGENVKTDVPETVLRQWIFNFNSIKPEQIQSLNMNASWKSPYVYIKQEDLIQALATLRADVGLKAENQHKLGDVVGVEK